MNVSTWKKILPPASLAQANTAQNVVLTLATGANSALPDYVKNRYLLWGTRCLLFSATTAAVYALGKGSDDSATSDSDAYEDYGSGLVETDDNENSVTDEDEQATAETAQDEAVDSDAAPEAEEGMSDAMLLGAGGALAVLAIVSAIIWQKVDDIFAGWFKKWGCKRPYTLLGILYGVIMFPAMEAISCWFRQEADQECLLGDWRSPDHSSSLN